MGIITFIFYLHIYNHLYVSNTLDLHYIPSYHKQAVDNLVDLKQPFYFNTTELSLSPELKLLNHSYFKTSYKKNIKFLKIKVEIENKSQFVEEIKKII